MRIAYYITAHGYGHGSRSCDIIRALRRLRPEHRVIVVSDLSEDFLRARLPGDGIEFRTAFFDVGMVQLDSIRVDVQATLGKVRALLSRREASVEAEMSWLRDQSIRAVVCDIPAIPIEAAARAGVPRVAIGNFAWDWIYEEFESRDPAWRDVVSAFREAYAKTDLLLRLPFAEPMTSFPRREDIPLVASPGRSRKDELSRLTGADSGKPWILLSFTTLEWSGTALARIERLAGYEFFTVQPLSWPCPNTRAVDRRVIPFADVLASCDAVVTKPGFGILSECVVNRKPILYVERTDFREYPILEAAVRRYLRHVHLPARALYEGRLEEALAALQSAPEPAARLRAGGDEIAARRIIEVSGWR